MAMDFQAYLAARPTGIRTVSDIQMPQLADLTQAKPTELGDLMAASAALQNTANPSLKGALTTIRNAPFSDTFWNVLTSAPVQAILNTLDAPRNALFTQAKNWMDGTLSWGDLPIVGLTQGLIGAYTGDKVTTSDLLAQAGWENKEGWQTDDASDNLRDILSFVGDIALDPLTYLTFGAGSAAKQIAGAGAKAAKAAGLIEGTEAFTEYATKAGQAAARRQALGLNIPFGPEITLLEKRGPLKINSQKVGLQPAADLARKYEDLGLVGQQRYDFASRVLGRPINSFKDLNTQEWDYLNRLASSKELKTKVQEVYAQEPDPFTSVPVTDPGTALDTQYIEVLPPKALPGGVGNPPKPRNIVDAEYSPVNPTQDALNELADTLAKGYTYFDGLDGMSALGKALGSNRIIESLGKLFGGRRYVPVSTQLNDHRIAQGINALEDARLSGYAQARFKLDEMANLLKETPELKELTPEELNMLPYVIEGKWPQSIDTTQIPSDRMQLMKAAADKLKLFRDQFTRAELEAGVPYIPRENYFPINLNLPKDQAEFDAMMTELSRIDPTLAAKIRNAPRGFTRERKVFQSMADLRDFLDAYAGNETIQKAFGNAIFNPIEAYTRRAMAGAQEIAKMQSYQALKDLGLARQVSNRPPKGWKIVRLGTEDLAVPQEIEKHLNSLAKITTNDAELNRVLQKVDDIYTIWRRNATVVNPTFHIRQIIGNIFQNTLAGVTPKAYRIALQALNGKSEKPLLKYGRQKLTGQDIMKMAMEDGVIGTGSSTDYLNDLSKELGQRLQKGKLTQRTNPLSEQFVPGRVGRKASEWEDNWSRLAHYIHVLSKGGSRKAAKESVIKYLYDYSDLSSFGRKMRLLIPFYNWMRNNIPFQLMQAVKRPGLYQAIDDLQAALQDEPDQEALMDKLGINNPQDRANVAQLVAQNGGVLPDYIRERYINVGGNNYFNLGLPSSDLASANPANWMDTLFQALNPGLQLLMGLGTNRTSLGTPVDNANPDADRPSFPAAVGYTISQLGGYPGRVVTTLGKDVWNALQGGETKIMQDLAKLFLGVTPIDPAKQLEGLIYERARQLSGR